MESKSLALKTDGHLKALNGFIEIKDETIVVNNFAYIDYEVVSGGAVFFFVQIEKWIDQSYDEKKDLKEVFVEFTEQKLFREIYDVQRGVVEGTKYKMIDNDHEAYDLDLGLQEAEYKAFEHIIGVGK